MSYVGSVQQLTYAVCQKFGWDRDWKQAGVMLHLEVSEFIEALRGKDDGNVIEEAGDVLFVLLSILQAQNISIMDVIASLESKSINLLQMDAPYHNYGVNENV